MESSMRSQAEYGLLPPSRRWAVIVLVLVSSAFLSRTVQSACNSAGAKKFTISGQLKAYDSSNNDISGKRVCLGAPVKFKMTVSNTLISGDSGDLTCTWSGSGVTGSETKTAVPSTTVFEKTVTFSTPGPKTVTATVTGNPWPGEECVTSDSVEVTVLDVDLDVDADLDGSISVDTPDDLIEKTDGGVVCFRKRKEIILRTVEPASWDGTVTLWGPSTKVSVYDSPIGGGKITFNGFDNKFPKSLLPKSLWVQGDALSGSPCDVTLSLTSDPGACGDEIAFTVVNCDLEGYDAARALADPCVPEGLIEQVVVLDSAAPPSAQVIVKKPGVVGYERLISWSGDTGLIKVQSPVSGWAQPPVNESLTGNSDETYTIEANPLSTWTVDKSVTMRNDLVKAGTTVIICSDTVILRPRKIEVTHIKFDHKGLKHTDPGPETDTTDGLNIRYSFSTDLAHRDYQDDGEWIYSGSAARNEPFLYVVDNTVTIKAKFKMTPAPTVATPVAISADSVAGLFPNISLRTITFPTSGISAYEEFSFVGGAKSHQFDSNTAKDVSKSIDSWQWKANLGAINVSGPHTCYCILDVPKTPWYTIPETHPWVSALDIACSANPGADGATAKADVIAAIVLNLYNSGRIAYFGNWARYENPVAPIKLKLTSVIADWNGGAGLAMCCMDVARTARAFTTVMGCEQSTTKLSRSGMITLKKHLWIGYPDIPSNWIAAGADQVSSHYVCKDSGGLISDPTYKLVIPPLYPGGFEASVVPVGMSSATYLSILTSDSDTTSTPDNPGIE